MMDTLSLEKIFRTILKYGGSFADLYCETTVNVVSVIDVELDAVVKDLLVAK